jgi:hypothetical protein
MIRPEDYHRIPELTMEALRRYVECRIRPGGFLVAVLSNDLFEAIGRADAENLEALPAIVGYIHGELPGGCWGSPERYHDWLTPPPPCPHCGQAVQAEGRAVLSRNGKQAHQACHERAQP